MYFAEWEDELSEAKIPAVVIQTFVENSIKYSFERDKAIYIVILARQYGEDRIELMISDTGKGFQEETLVKIRRFLESHEYSEELGVGIDFYHESDSEKVVNPHTWYLYRLNKGFIPINIESYRICG